MKIRQNFISKTFKTIILGSFSSLMFANVANADIQTGTLNTSLSSSNQSTDSVSYFNTPSISPFTLLTVGEYDFSLPAGISVSTASLSGDFGSNILGSGTAQVALFADGIAVASCDVNCELASVSNDVAWSYTFSNADLAALSTNSLWLAGRIVLTAQQLDPSQVVLDPTTVSVSSVPLPPATWLMLTGLVGFLGFSRRKAV
jgi:hypothetical protein